MSADSRWAPAQSSSSYANDGRNESPRAQRWQSPSPADNHRGSRSPSNGHNDSTNRSPNWRRSYETRVQAPARHRRQDHYYSRQQGSSSWQRDSPDIDSLSNQMKAVSTLESSGSMRKSQRNWSAEHDALKRSNANDAPLISRTTDKDDNVLLTLKGQRAMWQTINDRIREVQTKHGDHTLPDKGSNHQQDLEKVTDLFRKLREAIFATKWANGDLEFSVQVFELSAKCSALASNMGELLKSLKGLVNDLYPKTQHTDFGNRDHYTALYILYHACYTQTPAVVINLCRTTDCNSDVKYATQVLYSQLQANYHRFFQLYKRSPSPAFTSMLNTIRPSVQERAAKVLCSSYYTTNMDWAKEVTGIFDMDDQSALEYIQQWSGGCIKDTNGNRQLTFIRKKARPS